MPGALRQKCEIYGANITLGHDPLPAHQAPYHLPDVWGEVLDVELWEGEVRVSLELIGQVDPDNRQHRRPGNSFFDRGADDLPLLPVACDESSVRRNGKIALFIKFKIR